MLHRSQQLISARPVWNTVSNFQLEFKCGLMSPPINFFPLSSPSSSKLSRSFRCPQSNRMDEMTHLTHNSSGGSTPLISLTHVRWCFRHRKPHGLRIMYYRTTFSLAESKLGFFGAYNAFASDTQNRKEPHWWFLTWSLFTISSNSFLASGLLGSSK